MTPGRIFTKKILADFYCFSILYTFLSLGLYASGGLSWAIYGLSLLLPFYGMMAVREKVSNIGLFLLAHILLSAWPLLIPWSIWVKLMVTAFMLVACGYSIRMRLRGDWTIETSALVFAAILNIVVAFLAAYLAFDSLIYFLMVWLLAVLICGMAFAQIHSVDASLELLTAGSQQPVKSVLRFNNVIILIFIGLVLVAAVFSLVVPIGNVLSAVGAGLMAALRFLFSLLPSSGEGEAAAVEEAAGGPDTGNMDFMDDAAKEPALWLQILEKVMVYLVVVAMIAGLIALIIYIFYNFYRRFYSTRVQDGDVKEFIGPELTVENLKTSWNNLRNRFPIFGKDEEQRIRRRYYKKVRQHIKKGVRIQKQDTTQEIAGKIKPAEDIGYITGQYEWVRYGKRDKR